MAKAEKYLDLLHYAKSARLFDPRQRPKLSRDVAHYTTKVEDTKHKLTDPKRVQVTGQDPSSGVEILLG